VNRIRALLPVAILLTAVVSASAQAAPRHIDGDSFTRHTFGTPGVWGTRDYWLYLPPGGHYDDMPLVVFLHGCNESAVDTAKASHFNALAAQRGFVVAYPQQNVTSGSSAPMVDGNGIGCWNWFLPDDQSRDAGEPATIAGITRFLVNRYDLDPSRVYVEGVSAGADMSVILGATYPDVYAAVGAVAGCAYQTCGDVTGALAYRAMGDRARVVPMFVENGTADTLNNMAMAQGLVSSWLGTDDLSDDGSANGTVSRVPATTTNHAFDQTPQPGSGDLCIHDNSFTCPGGAVGFQGTYPYTVQTYDDSAGREVLEFWVIHGMEHAHPDAAGDGPYTDPLGPDITTASYDFFAHHSMPTRSGS
jgi:poly(hydroxyalkanoate) depolymerase family esterase